MSRDSLSKGTVFIAWGGNKPLAEAVAAELAKASFVAQVGGDEVGRSESGYYLAPEILKQITEASRAIILAQKTPTGEFRPNLMFEWGYLLSRLPALYVHAFLVDIKKGELPSDLEGSRRVAIRASPDVKQMARSIATEFLDSLQQIQVNPVHAFTDWDTWKEWIRKQDSGDESPDNLRLAATLLHSAQPAYYFGEFDFLRDICSRISGNEIPQLLRAKQLASAISCYYELTTGPTGKEPSLSQLVQVYSAIDVDTDLLNDVGTEEFTVWADVAACNFAALCKRRMADADPSESAGYLGEARDLLHRAHKGLRAIEKGPYPFAHKLWLGMVARNLARISSRLDLKNESIDMFEIALKARKYTNSYLAPTATDLLKVQLSLRIALVELDKQENGLRDYDRASLKETISTLEESQSRGQILSWAKALKLVQSIAKRAGDDELVGRLEELSSTPT